MRIRAAVVNRLGGPFEIEELELDDPIGQEVLVEVRASGLCHSDLHVVTSDFGFPFPAVFGHEASGVVLATGPDVRDVEVGDHVVASLVQSCRDCDRCRAGRPYQCRHPESNGRGPDEPPRLRKPDGTPVFQGLGTAGFASHALIHENQLATVPADMPFPEAAILGCGTITGAGAAINSARVAAGDTVAVIGLGGVGLNVVSGAALAGARMVIGVDLQPSKLELSRRFGATHTVDAGEHDPVEAVRALTDGGADHVFEVIGLAATTQQAIQMAGVGGSVNLIGIHKPGTTVALDVADMLIPQRVIRGVFMGSTDIQRDIPRYAEYYRQGRMELGGLIAHRIPLDAINDGYAELRTGQSARSVITAF